MVEYLAERRIEKSLCDFKIILLSDQYLVVAFDILPQAQVVKLVVDHAVEHGHELVNFGLVYLQAVSLGLLDAVPVFLLETGLCAQGNILEVSEHGVKAIEDRAGEATGAGHGGLYPVQECATPSGADTQGSLHNLSHRENAQADVLPGKSCCCGPDDAVTFRILTITSAGIGK
jgi:hypothetical protein